jgi:hypothetical protein
MSEVHKYVARTTKEIGMDIQLTSRRDEQRKLRKQTKLKNNGVLDLSN